MCVCAFGDDDEAVSVPIDDITDSNAQFIDIKRRLGDQADVHVAESIAFFVGHFFNFFFQNDIYYNFGVDNFGVASFCLSRKKLPRRHGGVDGDEACLSAHELDNTDAVP